MKRLFFMATLCVILSGCSFDVATNTNKEDSASQTNTNQTTNAAPTQGGEWKEVDDGVARLEYYAEVDPAIEIIVYRFEPDEFEWRFENSETPQFLAGWNNTLDEPLAVMNGVYFLDDNQPAGMLITKGKQVNENAFDYSRSALLVLQPEPGIIDTTTARIDITRLKEAAQTYPYLIRDGKADVEEDSGLTSRRSFIGMDTEGRMYMGVVPYQMLSLHVLAKYIEELPVEWNAVVNVDGGTSTGLYTHTTQESDGINSYIGVPNVIVVEKKSQK